MKFLFSLALIAFIGFAVAQEEPQTEEAQASTEAQATTEEAQASTEAQAATEAEAATEAQTEAPPQPKKCPEGYSGRIHGLCTIMCTKLPSFPVFIPQEKGSRCALFGKCNGEIGGCRFF